MVKKTSMNTAPTSTGTKRTNRITNYTAISKSGRQVKKEIVEGATPPPKQSRKNGTTPDAANDSRKNSGPSDKKTTSRTNEEEMEYVDGVNIYDDSGESPDDEKNEKSKEEQATQTSQYDCDFPVLSSQVTSSGKSNEKIPGEQMDVDTTVESECPPARSGKSGIADTAKDTPDENETHCMQKDKINEAVRGKTDNKKDTSNVYKKVLIQPTLPVIVKRKFEYRIMVSFKVKKNNKKNINMQFKSEALQKALSGVLEAGQVIVSDFAINSWREKSKMNTIQKKSDIPTVVDQLVKYWQGPVKIQPGKLNWYWGIRVTSRINMTQFIQIWKENIPRSKEGNTPTNFHPIKAPPFQSESWHEIGWLAGSTEYQYLTEMERGLSKETGSNIKLEWGNVVFPGVKKIWDVARKKQKELNSPSEYRKLAPKATLILTDATEGRTTIIKSLYDKYGRLTASGEWPIFPDGCRLRYTPPSQNVKDQAGQKTLMNRMNLHVEFKWRYFTCPTRIIDPSTIVEEHGKSIGHLILSIMRPGEKIEEPYFRHFLLGPSYHENRWELVIHQHLYSEASELSDKLEEEVERRYQIDISQYFKDDRTKGSYAHTAAAQLLEFTLDDNEDMYLSGKTKFQFQGIKDVVDKNNEKKTVQEMIKYNDASIAVDESEQSPGEEEEPSRSQMAGPR